MSDLNYPHGKRVVRFKKRPANQGLQAEVNPKLPHIQVDEDCSPVEVSAELAWRLVEQGRAIVIDPAQDAPDTPDPDAEAAPPADEGGQAQAGGLRGLLGLGKGAKRPEAAPEPEAPEAAPEPETPEVPEGEEEPEERDSGSALD